MLLYVESYSCSDCDVSLVEFKNSLILSKSLIYLLFIYFSKIESVNGDYAEEYARFIDVYHRENIFEKSQKDRAIKSALRNNFHDVQYSSFISNNDLPLVYDKKLKFKGVK